MSMKYGQAGRALLLELQRAHDDDDPTSTSLPAYNDGLVSDTLLDLKLHVQVLQDQVQAQQQQQQQQQASTTKPSMQVRPSLLLQNAAIQRNKRCLLAYHNWRLNKIKQLGYWESTAPSSSATSSTAESSSSTTTSIIADKLCPAEQDFLNDYANLVQRYTEQTCGSGSGGSHISIIGDFRNYHAMPPMSSSDRVQVRVVDDTPFVDETTKQPIPIVLDSGATVVFRKHATLFCQQQDVQDYLRQGVLQIVEREEQQQA